MHAQLRYFPDYNVTLLHKLNLNNKANRLIYAATHDLLAMHLFICYGVLRKSS